MSLLRIAHLSDSHFGTILPGVREGLIATLRDMKPDLLLLTGDITQRARRYQFLEAKEFTRQLDVAPWIVVPGNHDIPLFNIFARIFAPYLGFSKVFASPIERDYEHGDVRVMGLNSTSRWRHVQGRLSLERLERRFKSLSSDKKVRIVAFHHPLDCSNPSDEMNLLRNARPTVSLFDRYGVDLVIGGHIHDPYVSLSRARYPHTQRNMILAVAGTCTSWRTRKNAPNSFNWIEVDTRDIPRMTISRYDQRQDSRFTLEHAHGFSRSDSSGWTPA